MRTVWLRFKPSEMPNRACFLNQIQQLGWRLSSYHGRSIIDQPWERGIRPIQLGAGQPHADSLLTCAVIILLTTLLTHRWPGGV